MKTKVLTGTTKKYNGYNARVKAVVTTERGYLSITGELFWRSRYPSVCGCIHEYIADAIPQLKPLLPFHLCNLGTGFTSYVSDNSLFLLANGKVQEAQGLLRCTDKEISELLALVNYGLHKSRVYNAYHCDKDAKRVFENTLSKMGILERGKREFYEMLLKVENL